MNTEDFAFDNSTNAEIVENFGAVLPRVGITILSNSLIVEPVHSSNLSGFMITSEESNMCRVLEFQTKQELESFYAVVSSINEVTHEDISGVRDFTALVEEFQEIMELTMDISANGNWGCYWLHIALFN